MAVNFNPFSFFQGVDAPPEINLFDHLGDLLARNEYRKACNIAIHILKNTNLLNNDIPRFYEQLNTLIPNLNRDQFERVKSHLQPLLDHSAERVNEQYMLAMTLGRKEVDLQPIHRFDPNGQNENIREFSQYFEAMDYFAKALQLVRSMGGDELEVRTAMYQLLIRSYLHTGIYVNCLIYLHNNRRYDDFERVLGDVLVWVQSMEGGIFAREYGDQARAVVKRILDNDIQGRMNGIINQFFEEVDERIPLQGPRHNYTRLQDLRVHRGEHLGRIGAEVEDHNRNEYIHRMRAFQGGFTSHIRSFFQHLFNEARGFLKPLPCDVDIRLIGAAGRDEFFDFSSLKIMVLIDEERAGIRDFLAMILQFIELQVRSFGETPVEIQFTAIEGGNQLGLCFDRSFRVGDQDKLVRTPRDMAELQQNIASADGDYPTAQQMTLQSQTIHLNAEGDNGTPLFQRFQRELRNRLTDDAHNTQLTNAQYLALSYIRKNASRFCNYRLPVETLNTINLKNDMILPITSLLSTLGLIWDIPATNSLDIIDALLAQNRITDRTHGLMKFAVAKLYEIRLRNHERHSQRNDHLHPAVEGERHIIEIDWLVLFPIYDSLRKIFPRRWCGNHPCERDVDRLNQLFDRFDSVDILVNEMVHTKWGFGYFPAIKAIVSNLVGRNAADGDHIALLNTLTLSYYRNCFVQEYCRELREKRRNVLAGQMASVALVRENHAINAFGLNGDGNHVLQSTIDLSNRVIFLIPERDGQFRSLTTLRLAHNQIRELPRALTNCRRLRELDISHNRLASLPDEIGSLEQLRTLRLQHNRLRTIPASFSNLRLERVDLAHNELCALPDGFRFVDQWMHPRLQEVDLRGNLLPDTYRDRFTGVNDFQFDPQNRTVTRRVQVASSQLLRDFL